MKKAFVLIILSLCTWLSAKDVNDEFRATWVITWEYMNASRSAAETKTLIRHILDEHQKANMNAVVWQVRQGGTSYYTSTNEPWGQYTGYKDPGFDPLAFAVEEAHKRGMEIHAWFNTFQTSDTQVAGTPARQHPEWVCRNSSGQPMTSLLTVSPGLKQVRDYTVQVAMDIVRRYDIDGLHLDYVRWSETSGLAALQKNTPEQPQLDGMISEQDLQALNSTMASPFLYDVEHPYSAGVPAGFATWEEWWRWSVTEFVATLHDSIQTAKPWVRLSAAALGAYNWGGWQGYGSVYQDAALWFNKGYVDQLMPMHYGYYSGYEFLNILVNGCPQCWGAYIKEGVAAGRLFSAGPGSYLLSQEKLMSRHADIVAGCRQVPWVDGFQFFSYGSWEDNAFFEQAGSTFFQNKTKIRAAKFLHDAVPPAPGLTMQKLDSLHYRLQLTPPVGLDQDQWYLIYRLAATTGAQPELLHIHFGQNAFEWMDSFTGMQDYNKRYTYFATLCDRFWNESVHSAEWVSDPIPSFAPTVVSSLPVSGDTITTKSPVKLTFSKTMNPLSFQNSIAFQPPVTIGSVLWSSDQRTCTITPAYGFNNNVSYMLQLSPVVKDVNGVTLDGNGDGKPGDGYKLSFLIEPRDMTGPHLVSMFPAAQSVMAPEEVLSLAFDEPLATASVNDNTVLLSKGGASVPVAYNMTRVGQMSILSVQPRSVLDANTAYNLDLTTGVTDTLGNSLAAAVHLAFRTVAAQVKEVRYIDQFTSVGNWKAPSFSGSTVGLIAANSSFALATETFLPNAAANRRNAAALTYAWDPAASSFLLREYMDVTSAGAAIKFDSTYTLQCYVFGDAGGTLFRFAVDDGTTGHEVSQWIRVDWYGWRLVEWRLGDPASFGTWIGDGQFSSNTLNIDSIQLTRGEGSAWNGKMYFDDLRVVKKSTAATVVQESTSATVTHLALQQNYPNPFNAETKIGFSLPEPAVVELAVYDLLGRQIAVLADGSWSAGVHAVRWDASHVPTGVYMYQLRTAHRTLTQRLMVVR